MAVPTPLTFTDHIYKVADDHPISLRIWPNPKSSSEEPSPILFWTHGGGWVNGARYVVNPWALQSFHDKGYTFVSVDYRFLPQVQLKHMLEDVLDAHKWIRENINEKMAAGYADVDRIAVAGDSAGGTMATLLGIFAEPKPKAVLNLYGVVDFTSPPLLNASHPDHIGSGKFSDEELAFIFSDPSKAPVVSHCPIPPTREEYETLNLPPGFEYTERLWLQDDLKMFAMRTGGLVQALFGFAKNDTGGPYLEAARKLSVLNLLESAESYPPTFIVHGTADALVEVEQSDRLVKALEAKGVPVKYVREEGGEHGNDRAWDEKTVPDWKEQIEAVVNFIDHHVNA